MKESAPLDDAILPDLAERHRITTTVYSSYLERRELDDGFALAFPKTAAWERTLGSFTEDWNRSCPDIEFLLAPPADDGRLWLTIRGPEGTKQFVEGARRILTSHLNPRRTLGNKLRRAGRLLSSPLRALPDFVVLGAKKCGTTSLYAHLSEHPGIAPAYSKEVHYFSAQRNFGLGNLWYRSHFPLRALTGRVRPPRITGEATPDYLFVDSAAARLRATVPNARLITILRDPVDRAYSFYHHNLRAGLETATFEEALDLEEERLAHDRSPGPGVRGVHYMHHSYKLRGLYAEQLERWLALFPREQLLVVSTENLHRRPGETLASIYRFLGLPDFPHRERHRLNAAPYPPMDPQVRSALVEYFRPHNQRLYDLVGHDFGWEAIVP